MNATKTILLKVDHTDSVFYADEILQTALAIFFPYSVYSSLIYLKNKNLNVTYHQKLFIKKSLYLK